MTHAATLGLQTTVTRSPDIIFSTVADEVTMMSVQSGKYYSLAAAGGRIWTLLDRPLSIAEISDRLVGEYRVDRTRCEQDVLVFVRQMLDAGVVVIAGVGESIAADDGPSHAVTADEVRNETNEGDAKEWVSPTIQTEDVEHVTRGGMLTFMSPGDDTWYRS